MTGLETMRTATPPGARALVAILASACIGAAPAAQPDARQVERLTAALVQIMPFGAVLDEAAAQDPTWPLQEKADGVDAAQLACMRRELSSPGFRRSRASEAAAYVEAHPSRLEDDIKTLMQAAPVFAGMVEGVIAEEKGGKEFDPAEAVKSVTHDQLLAFSLLMADPKYAPLRELSGIGDAYHPGRTAEENYKAGVGIGTALFAKLMIGAMKTCDVPPAALF